MGKIIKKAVYNKDKTECLKIGYFKTVTGEIQIEQFLPTTKKVPKVLPKQITSLRYAFENNINITISGIEHWDTSNVEDMSKMFFEAKNFNQSIGKWNTSNVTDMNFMFYGAENFNQDISKWDVSNVNDMSGMFYNATSFDKEKHWNKSLSKSRTR
ncbi:BspA family leucine-rich repeat surface protein [Mycoplasma mycoides]|uniref:BspA family leucine-rich repeat surface protein n=1 Tax=Mycoplasma mycoides TaxID=2102 RepID=UPI002AD28291|nr:BspA family leucine-rich repeat surface protein [Mycoplasma mycoides]QVK09447.1 DUF285 domain-containing protein [Mycoplasma mycoides subsp. capri]